MPCVKIFTNISKDIIPRHFVQDILPVLAKSVKKPEEHFIVMVSPDCILRFGGESTTTFGAVITLESIGNLGVNENKYITETVTQYIVAQLGIEPEHVFISFYDLRGQDIGKGGVTFS